MNICFRRQFCASGRAGRLIRTQTDRGVVAILDKRILFSKQYGRPLLLESLPGCTVMEGFLADLPEKGCPLAERVRKLLISTLQPPVLRG